MSEETKTWQKPTYVVFWKQLTYAGIETKRIYSKLAYGKLELQTILESLVSNEKIIKIFWVGIVHSNIQEFKICKNCGHEVRTGRDMGNLAEPNKVKHYVSGWGSDQCAHCDCTNPELREIVFRGVIK